jgi:hypothetical protein
VFSKRRQQRRVKARSLVRSWALRELEMSIPGVAYAAQGREIIATPLAKQSPIYRIIWKLLPLHANPFHLYSAPKKGALIDSTSSPI